MTTPVAPRDASKPVQDWTALQADPIAKPPPPMPPAERWANAPDGLREMLEALSNSNMDWDAPQLGEPIYYWVQVGHRLYHRNDLIRQAMKLEKWPEPDNPDIPKLELSSL